MAHHDHSASSGTVVQHDQRSGQDGGQHGRSHSRKAAPEPLQVPTRPANTGGPEFAAATWSANSYYTPDTPFRFQDWNQTNGHQASARAPFREPQTPHSFSNIDASWGSPQKRAGLQADATMSPGSAHRSRYHGLLGSEHNPGQNRVWPGLHGVVTALLVPMPFILSSILWSGSMPSADNQGAAAQKEAGTGPSSQLPQSMQHLSFFTVCFTTSAILVAVGVYGEMANLVSSDEPQKTPSRRVWSADTVRRVAGRILSVGLPIYACSRIGGQRVASATLISIAARLLTARPRTEELTRLNTLKRIIMPQKWTLILLCAQFLTDIFNLTSSQGPWQVILGYMALFISSCVLPPPYPTTMPMASVVTSPVSQDMHKLHRLGSPLDLVPDSGSQVQLPVSRSPLTSSPWNSDLTLASGILSGAATIAACYFGPPTSSPFDASSSYKIALVAVTAASSLLIANLRAMRHRGHVSLALGLLCSVLLPQLLRPQDNTSFAIQSCFAILFWIAAEIEWGSKRPSSLRNVSESYPHTHHSHTHPTHSKLTGILMYMFRDWPFVQSILVEKDSRRIFYFMTLNFAFMMVQTFYGYVSGSLGLLSDSVHMFFDCAALLVGLAAAVMSKWPSDPRFPYGYGMIDTLAGFANGIFLMLISLEIIYEAIERLADGLQMQRIGELLIVSTLGLLVNCVGMLAFGHAHHGHGHDHGHDHGHAGDLGHEGTGDAHSHDHHDHDHDHHAHGHDAHGHDHHEHGHHHHHHHHGHGHGNENMLGIWLHILADTLGSAAVVVSTVLVYYTGWPGFDPLASCLIAILIFGSAVPLVASSAKRLLLTMPEPTEWDIREALTGVAELKGIAGVTAPRFWISGEDGKVQGAMHVVASKGADMEDTRARAADFLRRKHMDVVVQVEREGETRCWCGTVNQR